MKSVKDQIDKLILDQESLIEKREKKQSSRQLLIEKRASMSREDLAELNKQVRGIEKGIIDISNQIDELRTKIQDQNEQVAEMKAQLVQLEIKMNEVKKERDSLEFVLEKERKKFEEMTLSMKIRLSEVSSYMHSCIMGTFYFQRHHSGHPERIALLVMLLLGKYLDTSLEAGMYHRYFPGRHMTSMCPKK